MLAELLLAALAQDAQPLAIHHATIEGLAEPTAALYLRDGRLAISEAHANRISVFDASGARVASFGESGDGALLDPRGLALSPAGNELFVVDSGHQRVVAFGLDGSFRGAFGELGSALGQLRDPIGVAAHGQTIAVADAGNVRVQLFAASGEPLRAVASELTSVGDVAFDDTGRLFVSDTLAHRVHAFDGDGKRVATLGDFGPHAGFFACPRGLAHVAGELYVVDSDNHRVQVFDASAKLAYEWGLHALRPREGAGYLHYPASVAISPDGAYAAVAEPFEDRVQIFRRALVGEALPQNRIVDRTVAAHFGPRLSFDGDLLAIAEPGAPAVLVYDVEHDVEPWEPINITRWNVWGAGFGQLSSPSDAAIDFERKRLYVADAGNATLMQLSFTHDRATPLGYDAFALKLVRSLDLRAADARVVRPDAIEVGSDGNVWALDIAQRALVAFTPKLELAREPIDLGGLVRPVDFALTNGGVAVLDQLGARVVFFGVERAPIELSGSVRPAGIAIDASGNVFVSDTALHRVQKFASSGELLTTFGTHGLGAGEFHKPRGLAFDAQGRLVVLDWGNHRAQLFTPDGAFITTFGARLFVKPALDPR